MLVALATIFNIKITTRQGISYNWRTVLIIRNILRIYLL